MKRLLGLLLCAACTFALAQGPASQQQPPSEEQRKKPVQVDPAYEKVANETGGQVYVFDRSKVDDVSKVVKLMSLGERDTLLSVNTRLDGAERTYHANVDTDVASLVVSVTGTKDFDIRRPSGPPVGRTENVVEYVELGNGAIYSIENPESGEWTLALRGTGNIALRVHGVRGRQSEGVQLDRFQFVEPGGRPGHEGMFAIQGFPLAGRETDVLAAMDGEISTLHFEFRSPSGEVLRTFRLKKLAEEYAGKVTIPDAPFLIYAVGVDQHGKRFQRMKSGQITPATFRVDAPPSWEIKAGQESTCNVRVTNRGTAGLFRISVTDTNHLLREISPRDFQLESDASVDVALTFQVITDPKIVGGSLVFTVERADTKQNNFAVMQTTVWQH